VDDELRLNSQEREFVNLIVKNLEAADLENNGPVGTSGAYTRLSNALQSMGEQESAMRMIEKALLLRPKDMDAMFAKAKLLFYSKKYAQARKSLEKIISAGGHENAMYLVELIDQISNS
jgi:tetratricopeptide (TPR) repeat protein